MPILALSETSEQPDGSLPALPAHTLERLRAEGVNSLDDWRRLSSKRKRAIFGITRRTVKQLDASARQVRS